MEGRARFTLDGQVTFIAGAGTIRLAPVGENWEIDFVTVAASTNTLEAVCTVYQGQQTKSRVVDFTSAGSTGAVSDTKFYVADGEPLFFVWTGGDATAIGSVTIRGWRTLPERGFRAL